jgi:hypothetical protein
MPAGLADPGAMAINHGQERSRLDQEPGFLMEETHP